MMKTVHENGSVTYTGFCQELLATISKTLNFSYEIYDVSEYGKQVGGQWQGAIGEVVNKVNKKQIKNSEQLFQEFDILLLPDVVGKALSN